jgi:hypothetical protein
MSEQQTYKERWAEHKSGRIAALRKLWELYRSGDEDGDEDLGTFEEYGLSFDYVAPHTFNNQPRGFFRYQLSYGKPSDEFRFMTEDPRNPEPEVSYWFMDWFDGYGRALTGQDRDLLLEIWRDFQETGTVRAQWDGAEF